MLRQYDASPAIVALAGPNGAGKSTFYEAHLRGAGLRFVNPETLARELGVDAYRGAEAAEYLRRDLLDLGESFVLETGFADPAQRKVAFLLEAVARGYMVLLCFIGLESAELAEQRVALAALGGGPDVPHDKLFSRYGRSLTNLEHALRGLPFVEVFDNSTFGAPPRQIARFEQGRLCQLGLPLPNWFAERFAELLVLSDEYAIEQVELVGVRERHTLRSSDGRHVLTITQPVVRKESARPSDRVHLALASGELVVQPVE